MCFFHVENVLQIVGMSVYCFLVAAFYCFLGLFLGNRIAEITVNTIFSSSAFSVALLFIRCAAIDPSDKCRFRFRKKKRKGNSIGLSKLNYGQIFSRILLRFFRRIERKILKTCIRRKYLDPWNSSNIRMEPLITFPLILKDDSLTPNPKDHEVSFCSLCDFEVSGISTYDYILAMKEENQSMELESLEDSDSSSDESDESDSPEKPAPFISRIICKEGKINNPQKLVIRIDGKSDSSTPTKKQGFRASIDPWKLLNLSREKALLAAERAREKLVGHRQESGDPLKPLPLETKSGLLMKPDNKMDYLSLTPMISKSVVLSSPGRFSSPRRRLSGSPIRQPGWVPSPKHTHRSDFDLKLTQVSREMETYISRQVLCSVLKNDGSEASPR
ncbi:hypothetical protein RD792_006755 [Penstemon davidsonii]|uniref:Uncharacterized protein n=1 Tax=Penstemon davidsonii TaxID=160366 RepID=A0ABR0DBV9_9LAMI|nr:hypothetical protein RD792_006755 [Penstemon davidsonii]